jgi:hypothetical protein
MRGESVSGQRGLGLWSVLAALALAGGARPAAAGPIDDKYAALGGSRGFLGAPAAEERTTPDGAGRYRHYRSGSIYWSPGTGAHEVHGLIRDKWSTLGWERSFLGYPVTDETATPDGVGRYNHFEHGSIYWSPETGAHEIHGLIREKWANLGWERGYLGYPVTDELETSDRARRFNTFQYGTIFWSPAAGAYLADTPAGSARLRVQLIGVSCYDTEDNLGEDELYLAGALAHGSQVQSGLTKPIRINDRQTRPFPARQGTFFDGVIPEADVVRGAVAAYDEDCGKDWERYGELVTEIGTIVGAGLEAAGYPTASAVTGAAVKVLGGACSLDKDDELGTVSLFVPASGPAVEDVTWNIRHQPGGIFSSWWSYDVRYRITRAR